MKLTRRLIEVRLDDPAGGDPAVFVFEEPKANEWYLGLKKIQDIREINDGVKAELIYGEWKRLMLDNLREVSGLESPDGQPVTVEQLKTGDVYRDIFNRVAHSFQAEVSGSAKKKAEIPTSSDSPSA